MDWQDLLTAFALYLILEGVLPFANPAGFKRFLASMIQMEDRMIRNVGIVSMVLGVLLLYLVR